MKANTAPKKVAARIVEDEELYSPAQVCNIGVKAPDAIRSAIFEVFRMMGDNLAPSLDSLEYRMKLLKIAIEYEKAMPAVDLKSAGVDCGLKELLSAQDTATIERMILEIIKPFLSNELKITRPNREMRRTAKQLHTVVRGSMPS